MDTGGQSKQREQGVGASFILVLAKCMRWWSCFIVYIRVLQSTFRILRLAHQTQGAHSKGDVV
jgi:hypothetical protein